ncbi:MAG: hypothetical protein IPK50_15060 [Fibrobacterota bacterium]|nr:MAG: hypothetical protein IPK50_15060 [Fibrobacterota bacterium]
MKRLQRFSLALLAATVPFFQACDKTHVVAGGSDDTHSSLDIQGRVLTKDASPFGKVIVRLRKLGIADTTDDNGRFKITSENFDAHETGSGWIDTLDYLRDGQAIHSVAVPTTIWTAPDLYLVQRDFSGNVEGNDQSLRGIWMDIVQGDSSVRRIELEWNAPQCRFSGFAYFRYKVGVDSFTAIAQAIDSSGKVVGKSDSTKFTSKAGDVVFPPFSAKNLLPILTLGAQSLAEDQPWAFLATDSSLGAGTDALQAGRGQTVRVLAEIQKNLERFQKVEWNLDGKGWVRSSQIKLISRNGRPGTSHPIYDTTFKIFPSARVGQRLVLRVRACTFDSVFVEDSVVVRIMRTPPMASIEAILPNPDPMRVPEGIAPKTNIGVRFHDSTFWGGRIVSRKLYIGEIRPILDVVTGSCTVVVRPDSGWSNPTRLDTGCGFQTYGSHDEPHSLGAGIPVSGADTTIEAPAKAGLHQLLFEVVDGNGDTTVIRSNRIKLLDPAPVINRIQAVGDSVIIGWTIPGEDTLLTFWHYWTVIPSFASAVSGSDSSISLQDYHPRHTTVLHPPFETRSVFVRLSRIDGFSKDTSFELPPRTLTFTGAIGNESRIHGRAEGIGGFRGLFSAAVGQYLSGEVGRLSWFSEDSTAIDGAQAVISLPAMGRDTLSLDLASPTTAAVRISIVRLNWIWDWQFSAALQPDSLQLGWDIPPGTQGHLDLAIDSATWSPNPPSWSNKGEVVPLQTIAGVVIRVQQTSGKRIKQGVVEFDNLRWH